MNATQNNINEKGWLVGSPHYGILHKYIRILPWILLCALCPIKLKNYHYNEVIHVPINHLDERLKDLILELKDWKISKSNIIFIFENLIFYNTRYIMYLIFVCYYFIRIYLLSYTILFWISDPLETLSWVYRYCHIFSCKSYCIHM